MKIKTLNKKLLLVFMVALIAVLAFALAPAENAMADVEAYTFDGGTGEAGDPYQIATAEQLSKLAELVNAETSSDKTYSSAYYILTKDITFEAVYESGVITNNWIPIANGQRSKTMSSITISFTGSFDGNYHTISGLYYETSVDEYGSALFGILSGNAVVKNVTIKDSAFINKTDAAAGIAFYAFSEGEDAVTISNCVVESDVTIIANAGAGILARNYSTGAKMTISNCINKASIYGYGNYKIAGMIAQYNGGSDLLIDSCENAGTLQAYDATCTNFATGGMIGVIYGTKTVEIKDCVNSGNLYSVNDSSKIGSMIGAFEGGSGGTYIITNCTNTSAVDSTSGYVTCGYIQAADSGKITEDGVVVYSVSTAAAFKTAVEAGGIVVLRESITITETISITEDVTITGYTGNEVVSGASPLFTVDADVDVSFSNLKMEISGTGIKINEAGDGAVVSIDDCTICTNDGSASYIVVGDTGKATAGGDYSYSLTFTNNTVTGGYEKPIHILMDEATDYLIVEGNSFTGTLVGGKATDDAFATYLEAAAKLTRSITVIAMNSGVDVNISNNDFASMYKCISIDGSTALASFAIMYNTFVDCEYAIDLDYANSSNQGLSLAYNFFGTSTDAVGEVMDVLYSEASDPYTGKGELTALQLEISKLELYPYYSDYAMTTLVEKQETTDSLIEAEVETLLGDLESVEDGVAEAALESAKDLISAMDNESLLEYTDFIETVESAITTEYSDDSSVEYDAGLDTDDATLTDYIADSDNSPEVISGLVLTADSLSAETSVGIVATQTDADAESETVTFEIKPYADSAVVSNDDLVAPVTFKLYLPVAFASFDKVEVTHTSGEYGVSTYILDVEYDETAELPYVIVTVTHFSEFSFAEYVTTSTSSSNITIDSKYTVAGTSAAGDADEDDVVVDEEMEVEPEADTDTDTEDETPVVVPTTSPSTADTSSSSNTWIWIVLGVLVVGGIVGFVIYKKKQ